MSTRLPLPVNALQPLCRIRPVFLSILAASCFIGCSSTSPAPPVVKQTAPTLSWATPAAIPVGIVLGPTQLNASANVPGTFTYSPAAGTSFPSTGAQTLSVTFTPTDTTDYTAATASVPLVVGRTWYVSGSGNDSASGQSPSTPFLTLQMAANSTAPGDFVYAMNGTYTSNNYAILVLQTPGTPNAWITWQAYPGASPVIQANNHTWSGIRFAATSAYISVSGFNVFGNSPNVTLAEAQAVESDPGDHPEANGNCIDAIADTTANTHPNHLRILNNTVHDCPGGGIGTVEADYLTISGNRVFNNSFYSAYGTSGISNLGDFDTNPADKATQYKIVITDNIVYGNQELVPWYNANPPSITDGEAIIIDSNKNSAYPAGGNPNPPYAGRTLIANNAIFFNGSAAIEVFQSAHVDVVNNSAYSDLSETAISGRGEMNLNVASDVNILNNVFFSPSGQNPISVFNACGTGCMLDYNVYFGGTPNLTGIASGPHDLIADPLYTELVPPNPGGVDLALKPGSPAIGSGTSNLAPATDILGNPRPTGAISRGAYQQ